MAGKFQSLVGLKINWNYWKHGDQSAILTKMFQSLVGLKINWNPSLLPSTIVGETFQSLVGLKINWNLPLDFWP